MSEELPAGDFDVLIKAQQRLDRKRSEWAAEAAPSAAIVEKLSGAIGHEFKPSVRRTYTCSGCWSVEVSRPGFYCDFCKSQHRKRSEAERWENLMARIPIRFRWSEFGAPELIERCGAGAVKAASEFSGRLLVLRGDTTVGKTSLATAKLVREFSRGNHDAWFIPCEEVSPDAPDQAKASWLLDRAMKCRFALLDDVGAELAGAPVGGGIIAMRAERMKRVIRTRHNAGLDTVVTVALEDQVIKESYGHDVLSRLTEIATDSLIMNMKGGRK